MQTEIDSLTIKDFEARYGIARSNVNNRLAGLKQRGYDLEPEKQDGRNLYNADQIALMDQLDAHIQAGHPIATFPAAAGVSQDNRQLSYGTQDAALSDGSPNQSPLSYRPLNREGLGMAHLIDAIAARVVELIHLSQSTPDPLTHLRAIQEACDRGWLLSTSQLAPLLGLKQLSGASLQRYGFTFTRVGRNGLESAWKVSQS